MTKPTKIMMATKKQAAQFRECRKNSKPAEGTLRVWHIPQVPMKPFHVYVSDLLWPSTVDMAKRIIKLLADYDLFQYENKIKPDYSSASGLEIYQGGEWVEWESEEGEDILEIMRRERL